MGLRLDLQAALETLLGTDKVYFQPPANWQIDYPCIVYERDRSVSEFAGNIPYHVETRYQVTVIDRNPDSIIPGKVILLPKCLHIRSFVTQNLHHDVFSLVF